ncbi:aquaporin-like protein [Ilyonectria robusta]|uniref:aquaporin-like protein n=1 Tax=Ilyonectria robusta TaxID=1079257 RepID=UPI001E8E9488|nr:aquaporin-like protein [Ilyonectria robusta]KAH8683972.1 aquaporin-like protein [Ilyonectria robusta]
MAYFDTPPQRVHDASTLGPRRRFNAAADPEAGLPMYRSNVHPFAGRIGANQSFTLDRSDDGELLEKEPDAAPLMPIKELMDLGPLLHVNLWKAAFIEGVGSLMLVYITVWASAAPAVIPTKPTAQFGNFNNAAFLGPLIGGITNFVFLSLFISSFGAVSGAHFNPLITIATFFARLCSLPRMILYLFFQIGGSVLAGLLVRASYGTRDFQAGGCWIYPDEVPMQDAFVIELVAATILLFLAFGVGLDPRQSQIVGPSLAPFLVGLTFGTLTFATAYTRYGYGGAGLNPARCLGVFVGSRFPTWHWVHWVPDILACAIHGLIYCFIPPWSKDPMSGHPLSR